MQVLYSEPFSSSHYYITRFSLSHGAWRHTGSSLGGSTVYLERKTEGFSQPVLCKPSGKNSRKKVGITDLNNMKVHYLVSLLVNHSACPIFCIMTRTVVGPSSERLRSLPFSSEDTGFCSYQKSLITGQRYLF